MRISDWSSDVCSSDLAVVLLLLALLNDRVSHKGINLATVHARRASHSADSALRNAEVVDAMGLTANIAQRWAADGRQAQIGRASCRERVCLYVYISVVAVSLKKQFLYFVFYIF